MTNQGGMVNFARWDFWTALAAALLIGCGGGDGGSGSAPEPGPVTSDSLSPAVVSTAPASGAIDVAVDASLKIIFTEALDPATVNGSTVKVRGGDKEMAGSVSCTHDTITYTPATNWGNVTTYTVTISGGPSGVKDLAGNFLAADNTWTFTTADKGWGTPTLIETASGNALFPQVAMDTSGSATVVWYRDDGPVDHVYANRYVPGVGWGIAMIMETGSGEDRSPQVAMDGRGNAIAVWEHGDDETGWRIYANQYAPGVGWGAPVPIETGPGVSYGPQVAVDSSGNAIAVWRKIDGTRWGIFTNRFSPGTGWGTATLIDAGVGNANSPQVTMDGSGNAIVVWLEGCELTGTLCSVYANRYIQGADWETPTLIETGPANAYGPQVAMDGSGNAIAVWYQGFGVGGYNVWANRFSPGTGWGTPTLIGSSVFASLAPPKLAMDGNGNAIAVWWYWGGVKNIYANWYMSGSGWGTQTIMHTGIGGAGFPEVAMDKNGNAIVVWIQWDGSAYSVCSERYVAGKGWSLPTVIDNGTKWAEVPEVAMDNNGNAVAVWMGGDGTGHDIWANQYGPP